ncbi:fimbrial protein [Klebsiella aerogenes]
MIRKISENNSARDPKKMCIKHTWPAVSPLSLLILMLVSLLLMHVSSSYAVQTGDSRNVSFHGILKRKPCHISNDRDIEIHFNKVGIHKVDGQRYMQEIPYTLTCEETDPSFVLKMTIKGMPSGFEESALKTNANGLGIRILQNGQQLKINDALTINYNNPPKLKAVPVQQSGVTLTEQDFSATATLLAEYQ